MTNSSESSPGWLVSFVNWMFSPFGFSSTTMRTAVVQQRLTGHNCVACQDAIRGDEVQAPCSHYYDKECILSLFDAATRDESLFPPRCCRQPIPLYSIQGLMTTTALAKYNEKSREFQTLKRVYCSNATCSRFLGPQLESVGWSSRQFLDCPADGCVAITCAKCKANVTSADRFRHKCKFDQDNHDVLAIGQLFGWARCPGCSQLVELNRGCNHMTCRCNTQFCYICQARWKTCACPRRGRDLFPTATEARDARLGAGLPAARVQSPVSRAQRTQPIPFPVPIQLEPYPPVPRPRAFSPLPSHPRLRTDQVPITAPIGRQARAAAGRSQVDVSTAFDEEMIFDFEF